MNEKHCKKLSSFRSAEKIRELLTLKVKRNKMYRLKTKKVSFYITKTIQLITL